MKGYPSRRAMHARTPNAVVALLDSAWNHRALGDRKTMRALAKTAMQGWRYFRRHDAKQTEMPL